MTENERNLRLGSEHTFRKETADESGVGRFAQFFSGIRKETRPFVGEEAEKTLPGSLSKLTAARQPRRLSQQGTLGHTRAEARQRGRAVGYLRAVIEIFSGAFVRLFLFLPKMKPAIYHEHMSVTQKSGQMATHGALEM